MDEIMSSMRGYGFLLCKYEFICIWTYPLVWHGTNEALSRSPKMRKTRRRYSHWKHYIPPSEEDVRIWKVWSFPFPFPFRKVISACGFGNSDD